MFLEEYFDVAKKLACLNARTWNDESFKLKYINDPRQVLKDAGIDLPESIDICIDQSPGPESAWELKANPKDLLGGATLTVPIFPRPYNLSDDELLVLLNKNFVVQNRPIIP